MTPLEEWDAQQFSAEDAAKLKGATIADASYGDVKGFDYDAVTLTFADGRTLSFAPWDYEGQAAGLEKRWTTDIEDCDHCKGSGVELRQGPGEWIDDPCRYCDGTGKPSDSTEKK